MSQITLPDNVKPILSPRSRPTTQYAFVPAMVRNFWHCPNLEYLMETQKILPSSIDDLSNSQSSPVCHFSATCP